MSDQPLQRGGQLDIDGSSRVTQGKGMSGCAAGNEGLTTTEKEKFPSGCSAQTCELHALKRALEISALEGGTVCTASEDAFGVLHTSGEMWEERSAQFQGERTSP